MATAAGRERARGSDAAVRAGTVIGRLRALTGLSAEKVARAADISQRQYQRIEAAHARPSIRTAQRLAEIFRGILNSAELRPEVATEANGLLCDLEGLAGEMPQMNAPATRQRSGADHQRGDADGAGQPTS